MKRRYPTDLSEAEWEWLKPYVSPAKERGRLRIHSPRCLLDAVFYVLRSGCAWGLLPYEFPPWKIVYWWFRKWRLDGTFERLNAALRERLRTRLGRNAQPSAGIVDSQSTKTIQVGGEQRGYYGGKKMRGSKRHLLVVTEGLVLKAKIHSVPRSPTRLDSSCCSRRWKQGAPSPLLKTGEEPGSSCLGQEEVVPVVAHPVCSPSTT